MQILTFSLHLIHKQKSFRRGLKISKMWKKGTILNSTCDRQGQNSTEKFKFDLRVYRRPSWELKHLRLLERAPPHWKLYLPPGPGFAFLTGGGRCLQYAHWSLISIWMNKKSAAWGQGLFAVDTGRFAQRTLSVERIKA